MQDAGFVRQAFAGIASRYVLANHVLSLGIDCLWRRSTARRIAELDPARVLDLATGSGDLAQAVQSACPKAKVLGADFSVPMMREAQIRHFKTLVAADGLALPFQDGVFDVLTVGFGLRNMASWPGALQEMSRVLKPGGVFLCLEASRIRPEWLHRLYLAYMDACMPLIGRIATGGDRSAYLYLLKGIHDFPAAEGLAEEIAGHGFEQVNFERLSLGIVALHRAVKSGQAADVSSHITPNRLPSVSLQ